MQKYVLKLLGNLNQIKLELFLPQTDLMKVPNRLKQLTNRYKKTQQY